MSRPSHSFKKDRARSPRKQHNSSSMAPRVSGYNATRSMGFGVELQNLPSSFTFAEIKKLCEFFGPIYGIDFKSKRGEIVHCIVRFHNKKDCDQSAKKLNGKVIGECTVIASIAGSNRKTKTPMGGFDENNDHSKDKEDHYHDQHHHQHPHFGAGQPPMKKKQRVSTMMMDEMNDDSAKSSAYEANGSIHKSHSSSSSTTNCVRISGIKGPMKQTIQAISESQRVMHVIYPVMNENQRRLLPSSSSAYSSSIVPDCWLCFHHKRDASDFVSKFRSEKSTDFFSTASIDCDHLPTSQAWKAATLVISGVRQGCSETEFCEWLNSEIIPDLNRINRDPSSSESTNADGNNDDQNSNSNSNLRRGRGAVKVLRVALLKDKRKKHQRKRAGSSSSSSSARLTKSALDSAERKNSGVVSLTVSMNSAVSAIKLYFSLCKDRKKDPSLITVDSSAQFQSKDDDSNAVSLRCHFYANSVLNNGYRFQPGLTLDTHSEIGSVKGKNENNDDDDSTSVTSVITNHSMMSGEGEKERDVLKLTNISPRTTQESLKNGLEKILHSFVDDESTTSQRIKAVIHPSPDSTPYVTCAWVVMDGAQSARWLREALEGEKVDGWRVRARYAPEYSVDPSRLLVRNIPKGVGKSQIEEHLNVCGKVTIDKLQKQKGVQWALVHYENAEMASKAVQNLNGSLLKKIPIALDYTLPSRLFSKISKMWADYSAGQPRTTENIEATDKKSGSEKSDNAMDDDDDESDDDDRSNPLPSSETSSLNRKTYAWQKYRFMTDPNGDQKPSPALKKAGVEVGSGVAPPSQNKSDHKKRRRKIQWHKENVPIPVALESPDYDWLKYFLKRGRLQILQWESGCRFTFGSSNPESKQPDRVTVTSLSEQCLNEGIRMMRALLNDKQAREVGFTKMRDIPFELESLTFDWIGWFCGYPRHVCDDPDAPSASIDSTNEEEDRTMAAIKPHAKRDEFERDTGCHLSFVGKHSLHFIDKEASDRLRIKVTAPSEACLQRAILRLDYLLRKGSEESRKEIYPFQTVIKCPVKDHPSIDFVSLIKAPDGSRIGMLEEQTHCRIRMFGNQFDNILNDHSKLGRKNKKRGKNKSLLLVDKSPLVCIGAVSESAFEKGKHSINKLMNEKSVRDAAIKANEEILAALPNSKSEPRVFFYNGDAKEGRTLFVRNLPMETTEEILRDFFGEFGSVVSVKLVRDRLLGSFKGSAFIQFLRPGSVTEVLKHSDVVGSASASSSLSSSSSSAIQDSDSVNIDSNTRGTLLLNGRPIKVSLALSKKETERVTEERKRKRDSRNLFLAKEGIILSEKEMSELSNEELRRRIESWKWKKERLEDPNFHVSNVRLCVRNLPFKLTDKQLKQTFFAAAVLQRKRAGKEGSQMYEYSHPKIEECGIVRDRERLDQSGRARSKRYGFVQFREHLDAKMALNELNNRLNAFTNDASKVIDSLDKKSGESSSSSSALGTSESAKSKVDSGRLQIEFSIEDMRKVNIRFEKMKRFRIKQHLKELGKLMRQKNGIVRYYGKRMNEMDEATKDRLDKLDAKIAEVKQELFVHRQSPHSGALSKGDSSKNSKSTHHSNDYYRSQRRMKLNLSRAKVRRNYGDSRMNIKRRGSVTNAPKVQRMINKHKMKQRKNKRNEKKKGKTNTV